MPYIYNVHMDAHADILYLVKNGGGKDAKVSIPFRNILNV
jgi:hypothetical protein